MGWREGLADGAGNNSEGLRRMHDATDSGQEKTVSLSGH